MLSPPYSPHTASDENVLSQKGSPNTESVTSTQCTSDTSSDEFDGYDLKQMKRSSSAAFTDSDNDDSESCSRRMKTCWDALKVNPAKYLRQERSLLDLYPLRRHSWAGPDVDENMAFNKNPSMNSSALGVSTSSKRPLQRESQFQRNRKRATTPVDSIDDSSRCGQGNQVRVHDLSLNQIEDYAPPLSSLPPGKSLRAEWKGAPMDLSNDPDLHLLHPAEAHLASVLRLPCEVYLDSKRRLFAEKVHRLKQGLPFRRTDSQKACRIDVNKASRLFGAFEKIGWLQDELFSQYL